MTSETILIGIDLGTTNSAVAINNNGQIELIKKPGGTEYTPSVFGFDKSRNKIVGQRAYDALYLDATDSGICNFKPEVKRLIGTSERFFFERANIAMSAEEISAEILKALVSDILRKYPDFDTSAAVHYHSRCVFCPSMRGHEKSWRISQVQVCHSSSRAYSRRDLLRVCEGKK